MTAFSSYNTAAQGAATTTAALVVTIQTLRADYSPAGMAALTLNNLATSTKNWQYDVADARLDLDTIAQTAALLNQQVQAFAAKSNAVAVLD
jgi:hypothetical protein